jgi:hypothetical protein
MRTGNYPQERSGDVWLGMISPAPVSEEDYTEKQETSPVSGRFMESSNTTTVGAVGHPATCSMYCRRVDAGVAVPGHGMAGPVLPGYRRTVA